MKRRSIPLSLRFQILKRDKFRCQYCGRSAKDVPLHVDHKKSVKDGGTNDPSNLITACVECNLGKGSRSLLEQVIDSQNEVKEFYSEKLKELDAGYEDCLKLNEKVTEIQRFLQAEIPDGDGWMFRWDELLRQYDVATIYEAVSFLNSTHIAIGIRSDTSRYWRKLNELCRNIYNSKMGVL